MAKPAAAARRELNELRQRLQHLQQHYLQLQSSDELRDAIRESGYTIARAIRSNAVPLSALVLLPINEGLDATLQKFADWALSNTDANGRQRTYDPGDIDAGFPMDGGRAKNGMWELWFYIVERGSDHQRLIYTEGEVDKWLSKTDSIWANTPKMVWDSTEYRKQGVQFSLFCAELLARIDAVTAQPDSSTDAKPKQGYTDGELAIAIAGVIADGSKKWTAKAVADEIKRLNPDRSVGSTRVGEHPKFKAYKDVKETSRPGRKTGKPKKLTVEGAALDYLRNRTGRKTKPLNKEDMDDED